MPAAAPSSTRLNSPAWLSDMPTTAEMDGGAPNSQQDTPMSTRLRQEHHGGGDEHRVPRAEHQSRDPPACRVW